MNCPKCGKQLADGSSFCPYCGNEKLEQVAEEAEILEPTQEETSAEEQGDKVKNGVNVTNAISITVAILAVIAALCMAFIAFGDKGTEPAETTGEGFVADAAELFPDDYTMAYPEGFDYFDIDATEYVTLGEYKGIEAEIENIPEVTDGDVSAYIAELLMQHTVEKDVTDRPCKIGDTVVVDFSGSLDGVKFEGGTATNQPITLGAGGFIDGFEDGIVGMSIGETKVIDATFPTVYPQNESLAGKVTQFEIKLHSIKENIAPVYNDTFVRENFKFETVAEFEADVKNFLEEYRLSEVSQLKQDAVVTKIVEIATAKSLPEGLVNDYMYQQISQIKQYAAMYGQSYGDFVLAGAGVSAAEFEKSVRKNAEDSVKLEMALFAIANAEGITATDEDIAEETALYLESSGASDLATMCQQMGVTEDFFTKSIKFSVIYTKTVEFLMENATFTVVK